MLDDDDGMMLYDWIILVGHWLLITSTTGWSDDGLRSQSPTSLSCCWAIKSSGGSRKSNKN